MLYTLFILIGAAIAATVSIRHAERQALVEDAARANQQLALYANSLHTPVSYTHLTLPTIYSV